MTTPEHSLNDHEPGIRHIVEKKIKSLDSAPNAIDFGAWAKHFKAVIKLTIQAKKEQLFIIDGDTSTFIREGNERGVYSLDRTKIGEALLHNHPTPGIPFLHIDTRNPERDPLVGDLLSEPDIIKLKIKECENIVIATTGWHVMIAIATDETEKYDKDTFPRSIVRHLLLKSIYMTSKIFGLSILVTIRDLISQTDTDLVKQKKEYYYMSRKFLIELTNSWNIALYEIQDIRKSTIARKVN